MTTQVTTVRHVYADASFRHSDGVGAYALYVLELGRVFVEIVDLAEGDVTSPTQLEVLAVAEAIDRFAAPDVYLVVFSDCRDAILAAQDTCTSPLVDVRWVRGHAGVPGQVLADAYAHVAALAYTGQPVVLKELPRARRRFADLHLGRGDAAAHQAELDALEQACSDLSPLAAVSSCQAETAPAFCG